MRDRIIRYFPSRYEAKGDYVEGKSFQAKKAARAIAPDEAKEEAQRAIAAAAADTLQADNGLGRPGAVERPSRFPM
jgi:hypothetical protein